MKTNQSRILTYLRFSAGCAFFAAAAALAFVATSTSVLTTQASPKDTTVLSKSSIQDSVSDNATEKWKDGSSVTPLTAAEEQAALRAYPADSTPFTAQLNAIMGAKRFMSNSAASSGTTGAGKGAISNKSKKSKPEAPRFNTWSPTGPFVSTFPSILTFSGAQQLTSGRITAMALDTATGCSAGFCRLWVGAAGGGVWMTTNALASTPSWTFLTGINVFSNAIGAMTFVPNGTFTGGIANGSLFVGTGEPNASADSEAGLGLMKSLDGGNTWVQLGAQTGPITSFSNGTGSNGTYTGNAFFGRSISKVVVDPTNANIIYVSSARGVRGIDSTYGGPTSNPPVPRPPFGLWKSTDAGAHFTFIFDGDNSCGAQTCFGAGPFSSIRGVHDLGLDPNNHNIVYAGVFPGPAGGGGIWRSNDGGANWIQIKTALTPADSVDRCSFSTTSLGANTRMYAGCGNDGAATAQVYRSDLVQTGAPAFTNLTAAETYTATSGYCGGQCWYDNVIYTPPGFPDIVYVGGSYTYGECTHGSNCRGVVFATDAGAGFFWNDATWDATNIGVSNPGSCCNPLAYTPNQLHPDQHFLLTVPGNPFLFIDGSDGGMVRSNGTLSDASGTCPPRTYPAGTGTLAQCLLLTGLGFPCVPACGVPSQFTSMNFGLNTLQFMSLSVASDNPFHLMGGTQDNGTFDTVGSFFWNQVIYGDGGQSGFNIANSAQRFNTFTGQAHDVNFRNGNPAFWVIGSAPIFISPESSLFYPPIIADPAVGGTIFEGSRGVWRTQDWAGGQAFLEANCPEFTTSAANPICGDFVRLGAGPGTNNNGDLEGTFYGGDRTGGNVNVIARTTSNANVAWAGSTRGRVFISTNVNGAAGSVTWTRLDADSGAANTDPSRVVTGIAIDPFNSFHAWVSYSGYNFNTPSQPGHIFSVTWSGAGTATWTDISNNYPDIPATSIVNDPVNGDLYVSSDFYVFRKPGNQIVWDAAGTGLPIVEVPKLTIVPSARLIYAASHGLGGWIMSLY